MNGIHDLGGMHGLGPIAPEVDEPVFHEPWERRAFGLFASTFVFAGYSVDEFRHEIEKIEPRALPRVLLLRALDVRLPRRALLKRGFVTREELDARVAQLRNGDH